MKVRIRTIAIHTTSLNRSIVRNLRADVPVTIDIALKQSKSTWLSLVPRFPRTFSSPEFPEEKSTVKSSSWREAPVFFSKPPLLNRLETKSVEANCYVMTSLENT